MKRTHWICCAILSAAVAACSGGKKNETPCAKVGEHLATIKWSTKDKSIATCKKEGWSESEKSCLLAARDAVKAIDCMAARIRKGVAREAKKAQKADVKPLALELVQAKDDSGGDLGYSIRLPAKYEKSMCYGGKDATCFYSFSIGGGSKRQYEVSIKTAKKPLTLAEAVAHASKSRYGAAYTVTKKETVSGGNYLVTLEPRGNAARTFYFAKTKDGFLVAQCTSPPTKKYQANLAPVCRSIKPGQK